MGMGRLVLKNKKLNYKNVTNNKLNIKNFKNLTCFLKKIINNQKYSQKFITILNNLVITGKKYHKIIKLFQEKYVSYINTQKLYNKEILIHNSIYLKIFLKVIKRIMYYYY